MNLLPQYVIAYIITSVTIFCLGTFCLLKDIKRKVYWTFAIYCYATALWSGGAAFAVIAPDKQTAFLLTRIFHSGVIFISPCFVHFVQSLLNIKGRKRKIIILGYILCFFFLACNYTKLLIVDVVPKCSFKYYFQPGLLYPFFLTFWIALVVYGLYELFKAYTYSSGAKQNQLKYLCWGTLLGYLGGAPNYLPAFDIEIFPINPFGTYGVPIYVMMVTYAIVRHRLMDINMAVRIIVANLLMALLLSGISISLYISPIGPVYKIIIGFVLAIIISFYLPKTKFLLESFVNRILYGTKYDYQETLAEVSDTVPTIIDLNKLLKYITDKVCEAMGIAKGAVLLRGERENRYSVHYQHGFDGEKASILKLEVQSALITKIKHIEDVLVRHEMMHLLKRESFNELCIELDKFDAEVVVPIKKGENLIGIFTLSNKAGGDTFGQEDFRLLHVIAIQAAVAIENIRLYNKLVHTDRQTFLETLSSGVSHELRNRLVAIRTFIDLFPFRVNTENVEKGYLEFRELAVREMERLTKIIDGLLSYSRAVTKGGEELSVNGLLEESLLIIGPKLKEKEIKLVKKLDENVSTIKGDKGRLLQVFINIIQNGIDAVDKGGQLSIISIDRAREIEAAISDNGRGIDEAHLDAIFEPFFTTRHNGTGLGLSIVQRIIRDHHGDVRVNSQLGKGTTFIITFLKGAEYKPTEIKPKEGMGYWEVKKESGEPESGKKD